MALCRIMIMDYEDGTGRYSVEGREWYTDEDLEFGILYAQNLLEEGHLICPIFPHFDLNRFILWAKNKLGRNSTCHKGKDNNA